MEKKGSGKTLKILKHIKSHRRSLNIPFRNQETVLTNVCGGNNAEKTTYATDKAYLVHAQLMFSKKKLHF